MVDYSSPPIYTLPVRKAYSYLRFSTPEQAKGDSKRRQLENSKKYCRANDLSLDNRLQFRDEGISAFKGRNKQGALGEFLRLAQRGDLEPNCVLLVESLDRISREKPRLALRTLEAIVETGVEVVTLFDGHKHTAESLDSFTGLMASMMIMARAHEESSIKAKRLKDTWKEKRASGKPLGAICPGWLKYDKANDKYVAIPDRAQLVKRIFKMTLSGYGKRKIAKTFTKEKIPRWRNGKYWHDSYVQKVIHNEAVIGTFYPHEVRDKKRVNLNTPIKNYFPAVISESDYRRVQALSKRSTPGRTVKLSNLFTNICFDGYNPNSVMRFVDKGTKKRGQGKWKYLVSDAEQLGTTNVIARTRYEDFENKFLNDMDGEHVDLREIFKDDPAIDDAAVEILQSEFNETNIAIGNLSAAIERGQTPDPILERMRELDKTRRQQIAELGVLREKRMEAESLEASFEKEWKRFGELLEAKTVDARLAIRQHIRRMVKRIELFPYGIGDKPHEWEGPVSRDAYAYSVEYANGTKCLFIHGATGFSLTYPKGYLEEHLKKYNFAREVKHEV